MLISTIIPWKRNGSGRILFKRILTKLLLKRNCSLVPVKHWEVKQKKRFLFSTIFSKTEMFITAHSWLTESLFTHNYILIKGWYTTTKLPMTCHKLYTDQPGLLTTDFNANSELLSGISSILLCKFLNFRLHTHTAHTHCSTRRANSLNHSTSHIEAQIMAEVWAESCSVLLSFTFFLSQQQIFLKAVSKMS